MSTRQQQSPLKLTEIRRRSQQKFIVEKEQSNHFFKYDKEKSESLRALKPLKDVYLILNESKEGKQSLKESFLNTNSSSQSAFTSSSPQSYKISVDKLKLAREDKWHSSQNEINDNSAFITTVPNMLSSRKHENSKSMTKTEVSLLGIDEGRNNNSSYQFSGNSQVNFPSAHHISSSHNIINEEGTSNRRYKEGLKIIINSNEPKQNTKQQQYFLHRQSTQLIQNSSKSTFQSSPLPRRFINSPLSNSIDTIIKKNEKLNSSSRVLHLLKPDGSDTKKLPQKRLNIGSFNNLKLPSEMMQSNKFKIIKKKQEVHTEKILSIQDRLKETQYLSELLTSSKGFSQREREGQGHPGNKDIDHQYRQISKIFDKIEEKNNFFGQQPTFLVDFISTQHKINLPPKKMGFLKENKKCSVLNVDNYQMSQKISEFFTKMVSIDPYKNNLLSISANNDQITDTILSNILDHIPPKIEHLSLKSNFISNLGIYDISLKLQSLTCTLIHLDLENNKIRDLGAKNLFKALIHNSTLSKLNLSQNMIGDMCSNELRELLESQMALQELYLKWNNLRLEGGIAIALGLKKNQSLRVLDISYNSFDREQTQKLLPLNSSQSSQQQQSGVSSITFGDCMGEALLFNKKLIHLDMSSCNIVSEDIEKILPCLKKNQTLFGLHVANNSNYYVDEKGYIQKDSPSLLGNADYGQPVILTQGRPSAFTHSIQGVQNTISSTQKRRNKDSCWLCEGWEYLEFNYDDNFNTKKNMKGYLYIHFDFEGFKPQKITKINSSSYQIKRMCPPNRQIKYFLAEPDSMQIIIDENCPIVSFNKEIQVSVNYYSNAMNNANSLYSEKVKQTVELNQNSNDEDSSNNDDTKNIHIFTLNKMNTIQSIQSNIFSSDYYLLAECNIREEEEQEK